MEILFTCGYGQFTLKRYPDPGKTSLRAWDAADEYCLKYLAETLQTDISANILLINDHFGCLTVALHSYNPVIISDSYLAQQAIQANLADNKLAIDNVQNLNSLQQPDHRFDIVVIRATKSLTMLEYQLIRLRDNLKPTTMVIVAGMSKYLPSAVWHLVERIIGPTATPPAQKKAKIIIATPNLKLPIPANRFPSIYRLENTDYLISNHANVFSRERLDIGTRFLIEHLPYKPDADYIIDLGCGNGIIGLLLTKKHPLANLQFVDESYMAIASASTNFHSAFPNADNAKFTVNDALTGFANESADLIVCNPPFHQHSSINDQTAKRMFKQAQSVLRRNGEFWVIGNRHLGYHRILKNIFKQTKLIASNSKFIIIKASK